MDSLAPIPTPPSQRWKEFRIQALPVVTFIAVLVCVIVLWRNYVVPTSMVGQVELVQANVISSVPATVKEIKVKQFQHVKAGDEIAVLSALDTETVQASLRAAEGDLKLMRARMQLDIERNTQSYEQTHLEYLREVSDVAVERIRADIYEAEANRQYKLLTNTPKALTSQTDYDAALLLAASTRTNVLVKEAYLKQKAETLPKLQPSTKADEAILEAIKGQEDLLRAEGSTISIKAPIDGVVSSVNVFAGSKIVQNLPLVTIVSTEPTRIIAYVRKPYGEIPKPGQTVKIRRQSSRRETADGTVLDVSLHLAPISTSLVPMSTAANTNELGLPFSVSIPAQLALLPGEAVDLMLDK
jgi:multidrug resistance efflux pump